MLTLAPIRTSSGCGKFSQWDWAVGQTLIGRLSDIFGRRRFLAGGQGLGLVGAIICPTAKDVSTIIGGSAIVGLAGSTALSVPFISGELVPMKYRFIGNAYATPGASYFQVSWPSLPTVSSPEPIGDGATTT